MTSKDNVSKKPDYSGMKAVFINCTLTPSPAFSHTECLMDVVQKIMEDAGISVEVFRSVDHDIAPGVYPDMTDHGFAADDWPAISGKVMEAEILVIGTPIWLGDVSSEMPQIIERLYAHSEETMTRAVYFHGKAAAVSYW